MGLAGIAQQLRRALDHHPGVTAPAVWGKTPAHGDFVSHRAPLAERQAWQQWVEQVWSLRPRPTNAPLKSRLGEPRWMQLDATPPVRRLHEVPIAFVMPPGSLAFASSQFVQGVLVPSEDKVGRACPLVIYQKVDRAWMHRLWLGQADADGKTHLYWWARWAWRVVHGDVAASRCFRQLDDLWALQTPGLAQWLGAPPKRPEQPAVEQVLGVGRDDDPAFDLRGVYHLPWADWPERVLRRSDPVSAFWTQDGQGGYVQAGNSLMQLWGRS